MAWSADKQGEMQWVILTEAGWLGGGQIGPKRQDADTPAMGCRLDAGAAKGVEVPRNTTAKQYAQTDAGNAGSSSWENAALLLYVCTGLGGRVATDGWIGWIGWIGWTSAWINGCVCSRCAKKDANGADMDGFRRRGGVMLAAQGPSAEFYYCSPLRFG